MKFNELDVSRSKSGRRVGRGIAAGQGKTAGRGTKGYGARTGSKARPGFTGGQNPIMQKLPKLPGFRSHRIAMETVYTGQLDALAGSTVNTENLASAGLVSNPYVRVKLLAKGDVTKPVTVELQGASTQAVEAVEAAGGSYKTVPRTARPAKKTDTPAA
ncbi:MAG TPA: 50S ribosomal protein L15 [Candidatus Saccharimonadales bacterium]|nr:50S ribosomal protein L15 [Candidatus Saccharimonadales bacterium]